MASRSFKLIVYNMEPSLTFQWFLIVWIEEAHNEMSIISMKASTIFSTEET